VAAEDISIDMLGPWPVPDMEIVLLQRQNPAGMLPGGLWLRQHPDQRGVVRYDLEMHPM